MDEEKILGQDEPDGSPAPDEEESSSSAPPTHDMRKTSEALRLLGAGKPYGAQ